VGYLLLGSDWNSSFPEVTVQNCIALNPNVSGTGGTDIGRISGCLETIRGTPILKNNYGRSDIKRNGGSPTWTNSKNDLDGASITSSDWGSQSWWTNTAGWNFNTVWQWGSNNLPILRNMPGTTTQNPVVK